MSEYEEQDEVQEEEEFGAAPSHEDVIAARKLTFQDVKDHISGPVVSVVLHVIAIAFLSTIIVFEAPKEGTDIEVKEVVVDIKELEKIPEPPEPEEIEVEQEVEIERPDVTTEDTEVVVEDVAVDAPAADVVMPNILSVKPTNSALVMPALFGMRTGNGRKTALKRYGGSGRTERAVLKGLRWLKDHQNPDGSWGDTAVGNRSAFTGFALLAFLAHGETPSSAEFGPTVLKAIKKLVEYTGPAGTKVKGGYRHGIVMYALSEAYAVTRIPMLESVVNKGMAKLIAGLNPDGSFLYGYNTKGRSDLSVAGWNYQAMKAAFAGGCTAEGLEAAIDKSINVGLKKTHCVKTGGFSYSYEKGKTGGAKPTMSAVGTLCLQLFGEGKSIAAKKGLAYLESPSYYWCSWKGNNGNVPAWALYQWYYQTQAFFQGYSGKGGGWKKWNKMFTRELLKRQKSDGRWETPAFEHNPGKKGHGEGMFKGLDQPVYATSLCCLMLEVYYRYLPTFKVAKHKPAAADAGEGEDDDLGLKMQ
jgi:hypothetical protein